MRCAAVSCFLGALLPAQAATSPQHVLLQSEGSDGTRAQTGTYVLESAVGTGAMARPATSAVYRLVGGFPATLTVPARGKPWLTSVSPPQVGLRSQATLTLHGTELDLGSNPTVRIGGLAAPFVTRSRDALTTILPILPEPGYQPVEVSNDLGTTVLPRGLAVLPLLETSPAAADNVPFDLVLRGTRGDQVLWAIGIAQGPPIPIDKAWFGFALVPPTFLVFTGYAITGTDGTLRLPIPASRYPTGAIHVQALFLSNHPAYAPASFSNVINV